MVLQEGYDHSDAVQMIENKPRHYCASRLVNNIILSNLLRQPVYVTCITVYADD